LPSTHKDITKTDSGGRGESKGNSYMPRDTTAFTYTCWVMTPVATFDLLLYMLGSMFVAADFDVGRLCRWRLAEYWFADGVGGYWLVVCCDRGT